MSFLTCSASTDIYKTEFSKSKVTKVISFHGFESSLSNKKLPIFLQTPFHNLHFLYFNLCEQDPELEQRFLHVEGSMTHPTVNRRQGTGDWRAALVYIPGEEKGLVQRCLSRWWKPLTTPSSQLWTCCTPGCRPGTRPAPPSLTDPSHSAPTLAPHSSCCQPGVDAGDSKAHWARSTPAEISPGFWF